MESSELLELAKDPYMKMSTEGKRVVEVIELCARYDVLVHRASVIPGYLVPQACKLEINKRFTKLTEAEQAAVTDFRSTILEKCTRWTSWRDWHLSRNPDDAHELFRAEQDFHPFQRGKLSQHSCGNTDRNWRMHHWFNRN